MFADILWYHNNKFIKSNDSIKIDTNIDECKTSCTIVSASNDFVGFYQCKALNDVAEVVTRAKFDLASGTRIIEENTQCAIEESQTEVSQIEEIHEVKTEKVEKTQKMEKTKKKVKTQTKKTINKSNASSAISIVTKGPEKIAPAQVIIEIPKSEEISSTTQFSSSSSKTHIHKETHVRQEADIEIHEDIEEIHIKVYKELTSIDDIENFKLGDEVNAILELIEVSRFGTGELPLRELATIGCLLKKGMTIADVIQLYHSNLFPALRLPESQAAMVQLLERQGFESLITEIISDDSADDEHLLAATVGFRAFMRMIEINRIAFEDIITKFRCEDFYSQEWRQNEIKEEIIQTTDGIFTSTEQRFTSGKLNYNTFLIRLGIQLLFII